MLGTIIKELEELKERSDSCLSSHLTNPGNFHYQRGVSDAYKHAIELLKELEVQTPYPNPNNAKITVK